MENITVNVFDDVLYLAWEFVYLIFFTRFVCVHEECVCYFNKYLLFS